MYLIYLPVFWMCFCWRLAAGSSACLVWARALEHWFSQRAHHLQRPHFPSFHPLKSTSSPKDCPKLSLERLNLAARAVVIHPRGRFVDHKLGMRPVSFGPSCWHYLGLSSSLFRKHMEITSNTPIGQAYTPCFCDAGPCNQWVLSH